MLVYRFIYKCRMCGAEEAKRVTTNRSLILPELSAYSNGNGWGAHVHISGDHYGVSDLQGVKVEEEEE